MLVPGLIIVCFLLLLGALLFIAIRLISKYTTTPRTAGDEHIINLRVTVQLILWIIPFAVILLGILGYSTYEDLKKKTGEEIREGIRTELKAAEIMQERIVSLSREIGSLYQKAKQDADAIRAIKDNLKLSVLPVGSIVAYRGQRDALPSGWHLCDGADGTPDLRNKFIMGSDFQGINRVGGQRRHEFKIEFQNPLGQITAKGESYRGIQGGGGPVTNISIPDEYQLFLSPGSLKIKPLQDDELPPYYTLAYIIKIR